MARSIPFVTEPEVRYGTVAEMAPGLRRIVANNPGKFTYRGTGTYIVGRGRVAILDPGPDDTEHVDALLAAVKGERVEAILVTHTHRDHSPASRALAEATAAPVYGFGPHPVADTGNAPLAEPGDEESGPHPLGGTGDAKSDDAKIEERGDLEFIPDSTVVHGDVIEGPGWSFQCLHTPGHISNHIAYRWREMAGVFTGDHIMGWSTTIIPPPDGNMSDYMASLRLLADSPGDRFYWPTHGPPVTEPYPLVEALYDHRLERERQILECLATGPATITEMVRTMYADVAPELHEPASRSVLAHLIAMTADGRVTTGGQPTSKAVYCLP
ncbi:MBL fold metallo-hydrolase [Candidatus Poriferisocius sp.]|uniref:MBL fold metallo-hydrolase n=1 Tax=Candidatus Poriferisocius sp. TaxID=3101276 RepID=UPI003B027D74